MGFRKTTKKVLFFEKVRDTKKFYASLTFLVFEKTAVCAADALGRFYRDIPMANEPKALIYRRFLVGSMPRVFFIWYVRCNTVSFLKI